MKVHTVVSCCLIWFVLLTLFSTASATTHYVCDCAEGSAADCQAGNDNNAGTSMDAPWQTYEQARQAFGSLAAGDSIRFCRGGAWAVNTTGTRWVNAQCRAENRCTIGAYAPTWGGEAKPYIVRMTPNHGFAFQDAGSADHEEGYILEDLAITSGLENTSGHGILFQNDIDDVLMQRLEISNFILGVLLNVSNDCNPADTLCDGLNKRIVLQDSLIFNNHGQGWLGSSDDVHILNNTFRENGRDANFTHQIYMSASSRLPTTHGIIIRGNTLYKSLSRIELCDQPSLVVHGDHRNMVIENNDISDDIGRVTGGCWGIAVDPGYNDNRVEGFSDVIIRGNTIRNMGNISIGVTSCDACTIENNVIIQNQPASAFNSRGIMAPNRIRLPNDLPMDRVTIRNNSIYFGDDAVGTGIILQGEGSDHTLANNAILYTGSGRFSCFDADLPASSYRVFDHNLCHAPNSNQADWVRNQGSLVTRQNNTSFDAHSIDAVPNFTDPDSGDLRPESASSSLVNQGLSGEASQADFNGTNRDSLPDIGAFEWVETLPNPIFQDGFEASTLWGEP